MMDHSHPGSVGQRNPAPLPLWIGFLAFLGIALLLLLGEHRVHLLGAAPYLLLLLCPALHLFMHGRHGRHETPGDRGHAPHERGEHP